MDGIFEAVWVAVMPTLWRIMSRIQEIRLRRRKARRPLAGIPVLPTPVPAYVGTNLAANQDEPAPGTPFTIVVISPKQERRRVATSPAHQNAEAQDPTDAEHLEHAPTGDDPHSQQRRLSPRTRNLPSAHTASHTGKKSLATTSRVPRRFTLPNAHWSQPCLNDGWERYR